MGFRFAIEAQEYFNFRTPHPARGRDFPYRAE
jgi:hypothetical protein